jgi:protein-S-isoprenylcysteine O-methyltransferase Ste14
MAEKAPSLKPRPLLGYLSIFILTPTATYLIGKWIDNYLKLPEFPPYPINLVSGTLVFLTGLFIGIKSTRLLYLHGLGLPWGGVKPSDLTKRLVTNGLYAYTRNPMVLGYSMLPLGMGLMFQSIGMTTFIPLLVLTFNILIVKTREEKRLEKSFGAEYVEYKKKTPFLIPKPGKVLQAVSCWKTGYLTIIIIPILALALLYGLIYYYHSTHLPGQRETSDYIFLLICLTGILLGLKPKLFSTILNRRRPLSGNETSSYRGHHPPCKTFSNHTLKIGGKILCSGCTGLIAGAIFAIIVTAFRSSIVTEFNTDIILWIGGVAIILGIFQHLIDQKTPLLHSTLNMLLVIGVALTRSAAQIINNSFTLEAYILIFALYLVLIRITLSENDHKETCSTCGKTCDYSYVKNTSAVVKLV